uniref:Uncharacterized protein n=1 Tax=Cacopsylla melanoneura TaxID=428564 RepID=A0A8D8ZGM8_9HEMI
MPLFLNGFETNKLEIRNIFQHEQIYGWMELWLGGRSPSGESCHLIFNKTLNKQTNILPITNKQTNKQKSPSDLFSSSERAPASSHGSVHDGAHPRGGWGGHSPPWISETNPRPMH